MSKLKASFKTFFGRYKELVPLFRNSLANKIHDIYGNLNPCIAKTTDTLGASDAAIALGVACQQGCAPPVGAYDPKELDKKRAATLGSLKSERFKAPKEVTPGPGSFNASTVSFSTPSKKRNHDLTITSNGKKVASKLSVSSSSSMESLNKSRGGQDRDSVFIRGECERCQQLMEQSPSSSDWVQSLQKCRDSLAAQKIRLQEKLRDFEQETWQKEDTIRFLKGEVSAVTDNMLQGEQTLFEANAEIAEYKEKIEILEEEESTVNENIRTLSDKYQLIEKQLAEEQSCRKKHVAELQSRLDITNADLIQTTEQFEELQIKNKALLQTINKDKTEIEKLVYQIDEEKKRSCDLDSVLENKEETITDLEIQLEATKIELQNTKEVTEKNQEIIQGLQERIDTLQEKQTQLQDQLKREEDMNKETARSHADIIMELEQSELVLREENKSKDKKLSSAVSKCEELETQVTQLTTKVTDMEGEFNETLSLLKTSKEKEVTEMRDNVHKLSQEKALLERQVSDQTDSINAQQDKILLLQKEKMATETKIADQENELKKIIADQLQTIELMNEKLEKLCNEKLDLLRNLEQATLDKDNMEGKIEMLERNVSEVESAADQKELEWRDDFQRLTMELQEITEESQILQQKIANMEEEKTCLYQEVHISRKQLSEQKSLAVQLSKDVENMMLENSELKKQHDAESVKCTSLQKENEQLMNEIDYLQKSNTHFKSQSELVDKLQAKVTEITEENKRLVSKLDAEERLHRDEIAALQQFSDGADKQELEKLAAECAKWQNLYDDLQAKVEPFMEQLDAFELEKQSLLGRSKNAQAEVDKLSKEYARLLGHQNQRQKIHHILKIKEENNAYKAENSNLRDQVNKQKRSIRKLEDKVKDLEQKKRFDPSKSFSHAKENAMPPVPLKAGNRFTDL